MSKAFSEKAEAHKQEINDIAKHIIQQMKDGAGNWEMPWHKGIPLAQNAFTGKQYGGNNLLILWNKCLKKNYTDNLWATLYQWRKVKAKVKKGEKGTLICVATPRQRQNLLNQQLGFFEFVFPKDYDINDKPFTFRFIHVFNVAQVRDYYGNQPGLFDTLLCGESLMKQMIINSKAKIIHGGDRAYYTMLKDEIHVPEMARFIATPKSTKAENYYATIIHELIHWSGNESRCNRKLLNRFGTPEYAFEELVAELGTALLCTQLNQKTSPAPDHAQYLKSWLKVLENDFSYFTEALELARTAIYFINELTDIYPFLKPQHKRELKEKRIMEWVKKVDSRD